MMGDDVPEGFEPYARPSPLLDPWRPIWMRALPDRVQLGVLVRPAHCNARGGVHGGFLAALADQAMGLTVAARLARAGAAAAPLTASLTLDYLKGAAIGQWLMFDTHFAEGGRSLWLAEADIAADGTMVARARASFRIKAGGSPSEAV